MILPPVTVLTQKQDTETKHKYLESNNEFNKTKAYPIEKLFSDYSMNLIGKNSPPDLILFL